MNGRWLQLSLIAEVTFCFLAASLIWLNTAWRSWPGVQLQRSLDQKLVISADSLLSIWEEGNTLANTFLPGTHVHLPGLAGEQLLQKEKLTVGRRAEILLATERSIKTALLRDPAEPRAWARLALIRSLRQSAPADILSALQMSVYLAPADKNLLFWRLKLAAPHYRDWAPELKELFARQVVIGSRISPKELASAAQTEPVQAWIHEILVEDTPSLILFNNELKKKR